MIENEGSLLAVDIIQRKKFYQYRCIDKNINQGEIRFEKEDVIACCIYIHKCANNRLQCGFKQSFG